MGFGPASIASTTAMDIMAPGAPGLTIFQTNNSGGNIEIVRPTTDSDGTPITGLTGYKSVVLPIDGTAMAAFTVDQAAAEANAQVAVTPVGASDPTVVPWSVNAGFGPYSVICAATDEPL